jgi:WD40 repeat protein
VATLPGQVYQVYVQPDLQGIDYLTGSLVTEQYMPSYFKNAQLFSLRFDESGPRLLVTFPTGPSVLAGGGTQLASVSWSTDGGIFAFILAGLQDSQGQYAAKAGWVDLSCRESGECTPQYMTLPETVTGFYYQQFSPVGRRLLYAASVHSPTHGDVEKLYQVTFDATGQPGAITPVTQLDSAMEVNPRWLPDGNSLLLSCTDMDNNADVNNNHLCQWDLTQNKRSDLLDLNQYVQRPIMRSFELSPKGDLLAAGGSAGIQIFNRETRKLNLMPFTDFLNLVAFDVGEQNLYVLGDAGSSIEVVDLNSMTERTAYRQSGEGYIAWIGVVP